LGGAFTAFVAYFAGKYGIGRSLGLVSLASATGAACARKAPGTAAVLLIAAAGAWFWLGLLFEKPINPVTAPLIFANCITSILLGWARFGRTPAVGK
jgi:hypothetical protein